MTGDNESAEQIFESISWTVRLSDKAPWKLIVVVCCALVGASLGAWLYGPLIGLAGLLIVMGATAEFWMGTRYSIDAKGATARTGLSLSKMEWAEVRRVVVGSDGIKLSPLSESTRLAPFRGVFLRYGDQSQAELVQAVKTRLNEDVRFVDGGTERG